MTSLFSIDYAQNRQLDSTLKLLNQPNINKAEQARLMIDISMLYIDVDPSIGLTYADKALKIVTKLPDLLLEAQANNAKASNLIRKGQYTEAINLLKIALNSYEKQNKKEKIGIIYRNIATAYFQLSDFATAISYDLKSDSLFEISGTKINQSLGFINTCADYLIISAYAEALAYFQKGLVITEEISYQPGILNAYVNMIEVYNGTKEFTKSLEYSQKAYDLSRQLGNSYLELAMQMQIGQIYSFLEDFEKSNQYYTLALANKYLDTYKNVKGLVLYGMGVLENKRGNYQASLKYLNDARSVLADVGDILNLSITLNEIGKLYYKVPIDTLKRQGINNKDNLTTALDFQQKALIYAEQVRAVEREYIIWEDISKIYELQKNYVNAYSAYQTAIIFKDSVLNDANRKKITSLEVQYQETKKTVLIQAKVRQREIVIAVISFATLALFIIGILYFILFKKKKEADAKRIEMELELKALRAQINPHFISNALTFIENLISDGRVRTVTNYISKFSDLVREILKVSYTKEILLSEEVRNLESYMELENIRSENKLIFNLNIHGSIDPENTLTPPWLVQPILENSIKHGKPDGDIKCEVTLEISLEGDMLVYAVTDNGKALPSSWNFEETKKNQFKINLLVY